MKKVKHNNQITYLPNLTEGEVRECLRTQSQLSRILEAQFELALTALAYECGCVLDFKDRTPMANKSGFPDHVYLFNNCEIKVELKAMDGVLSPKQEEWAALYTRLSDENHRYYLWKPSDWHEAETVFRCLQGM
jgi:hypothetical protein